MEQDEPETFMDLIMVIGLAIFTIISIHTN